MVNFGFVAVLFLLELTVAGRFRCLDIYVPLTVTSVFNVELNIEDISLGVCDKVSNRLRLAMPDRRHKQLLAPLYVVFLVLCCISDSKVHRGVANSSYLARCD